MSKHSSTVVKKILNICGLKPEIGKVNSHGVSNIENEEEALRKVELKKVKLILNTPNWLCKNILRLEWINC